MYLTITAAATTTETTSKQHLFGGLASNAAPRRYNLRIVTDIAIVGPGTLVTAEA